MKTIDVRKSITAANDAVADQLRRLFAGHGVVVLNLIASPGAGKTSLLEKTIGCLGATFTIKVVEGDPYTRLDSERMSQAGADSVQINTEGGCHLDAQMVGRAVRDFDLSQTDLLVIENVGNLL
jgi:hydrogenase nickel incorporation protein HypB